MHIMGQKKSRIPENAHSTSKQNWPLVLYSGPHYPSSQTHFYGETSASRHQQGNVYEKEAFGPDVNYQGGNSQYQQHEVSSKDRKRGKKKKNNTKSKNSKNESDHKKSARKQQQHKKEGEVHTAKRGHMESGTKMSGQCRDLTPASASGGMYPNGSMNMNYQNGSDAMYNPKPSTSFPEKRQETGRTNRDLNEKKTNDEELRRQREINKQLQAEIKDLLNRNEELKEEVKKSKQDLHSRERDLKEKIKKQEEDLQRTTEKIKQLEADKNDLLDRLSSEAAARMTNNNPNITDLSDQDRPTKISERYGELYDNQWTDAYENLQKNHDVEDTDAIEFLLDVLFISYDECKKLRSEREALVKCLNEYVGAVEDDQDVRVLEVMKMLKDAQKTKIKKMQKGYTKKVQEKLGTKYKKEWFRSIIPYMDECVELCLLMNIQDPALELQGMAKGDTLSLDLAIFKPYTKSGKNIEHIVWPALCLYKKGPLLCKGVAQGMRASLKGADHDAGKGKPKTEVSRQQEETKVELRRDVNVKNNEINKLSEQDTNVKASPASQGSNRDNNAH